MGSKRGEGRGEKSSGPLTHDRGPRQADSASPTSERRARRDRRERAPAEFVSRETETSTYTNYARGTPLGRLRRTPGAWAYVVLTVIGAAFVGFGELRLVELSLTPDLGFTAVGTSVWLSDLDDLERGDVLVALNDTPIRHPGDQRRATNEIELAERFSLIVRRGDQALTVTAHAQKRTALHRLGIWVKVITVMLMLVLGSMAFFVRPGTASTWVLFLMAWSMSVWLASEDIEELSLTMPSLVAPAAQTLCIHLVTLFPSNLEFIRKRRHLIVGLYIPTVVLTIAGLITLAAPSDATFSMYEFATLGRQFWGGVLGVIGIALITFQLREAAQSKDAAVVARGRAFAVASTGLVVAAVWFAARGAGLGESRWAQYANMFPLGFYVGVISIALARHNALEVDRFTASAVGYATTLLIVGSVFAGLVMGLPLLLGVDAVSESPLAFAALLGAVFFSVSPVYSRIRARIDKRFFRDHVDAARMGEALRDLVIWQQTRSTRRFLDSALDLARVMSCERAELWRLSSDGHRYERKILRGSRPEVELPRELDREDPLGQALLEQGEGGVYGLAPQVYPEDAQEQLEDLQLALAAPLRSHRAVGGFVAVSRKLSGGTYSHEEAAFLSIIAGQVGLALERARQENPKLGRYRMERRLGVGGMAEVYLAWQLGPGGFERRVAIKRLLPNMAEEQSAVDGFLHEARVAARIVHPNVAQVFEVGEEAGAYYIAMEHVDGPSLRQVLRRAVRGGFSIPPPVATRIIQGVLAALQAAHRQTDEEGRPLYVVHRDVTPGNVLLNQKGQVKLVDFGIARAASQVHQTRTGMVKGTVPYMSPEQAAADDIDARSDLYSAAALLYELLTLRRAFPKGAAVEAWQPPALSTTQALAGRGDEGAGQQTADWRLRTVGGWDSIPLPASTLNAGVPPELDPVIYRALSFGRANRFESAESFGEAIAAVLPFEPASELEVARWLHAHELVDASALDALAPTGPDAVTEPG